MEATTASPLAEKASEIKREYAHGEDKPMGSHLILIAVYTSAADWPSPISP